ncbi:MULTISPECIES: aldo/keto reductase [unclassified Clostridium]|uniref:aldo/keto reductase n=1 Tax=unclassified Clostridium TaxID=2614128 RepID=UPI001105AD56|nr:MULTISPECIES: aldo/keto reductase [unclassified Clostridium]
MGYLGEQIPKLGFGLMRLPMLGEDVDIEQTKEMVDRFLNAGFTYFDTAFGYLGGKSELAIGEALVKRYPRESYQLATKLPAWAGAKNAQEAKDMLTTSLKRTGAGYFDFYLLHNLGAGRSHYFDDYGIWDYVQEQKAKGVLKHVGFSFHDKAEVLEEVLQAHPEMEFVQLQINYADWESDAIQSRACYEVARKYDKPVIIMEPVKGGLLAQPPEPVQKVLKAADPEASCASWALRFAASLPGLITVLSGMSDLSQMDDNLRTFAGFKPLDGADAKVVEQARKTLEAIPAIPCTNCRYCVKGCPMEINIPGIFKAANSLSVYGNLASAKGNYGFETREGGKASACIACGQCESVCPQHIEIIEALRTAVENFE